jgi:hypothetical protein
VRNIMPREWNDVGLRNVTNSEPLR